MGTTAIVCMHALQADEEGFGQRTAADALQVTALQAELRATSSKLAAAEATKKMMTAQVRAPSVPEGWNPWSSRARRRALIP